jgi:hypothetical protein
MELDRQLITEARQLITGANVHFVGGLILSYESIAPGSPTSCKLEELLRKFVSASVQRNALQREIESKQMQLKTLNMTSRALNRAIERFLASSSD